MTKKKPTELTLKTPTMGDRIRCNNIAVVEIKTNGSMIVSRGFEALVEWAKVGTGLSDKDIAKYTDDEIKIIGQAVKDGASLVPLPVSS